MQCAEFEGLWVAQQDGVLPLADRQRLQAHLEACAECSALVRNFTQLEHRLEDLGDASVEVPPYLKTHILGHIAEERSPQKSTGSLRSWLSSRRLLALSTACLAFFAGLLVHELHVLNRHAGHQRVQSVVLGFQLPGAKDVRLVGDFNDWGRQALPIQAEQHNGRWVFRMELEPGRYQYSYLVDGKRWLPDPEAAGHVPDGFGGHNSLLYVAPASDSESL